MPETKNVNDAAPPRFRKAVLLLAAAGLLLRGWYLLEFSASPLFDQALGADVSEYFRRAQEIVAGAFRSPEPDIHAPLYSWFLAAALRCGLSIPAIRVLQLLIGWGAWIGFACWLRRRTGETRTALAFLGFAMLYPPAIYFQAELICESLLLPLLLGGAALTAEAADERNRWASAVAGGLLGLAVITHPTTLLALVAGGIWLGCAAAPKRRLGKLACFAAAALVMIAPVVAARSLAAGRWVPVQHHGGYNLYLGNRIDADGTCNVRPGDGWRQLHAACAKKAEAAGLSRDAWFFRQAAAFPFRHPAAWLGLAGRKALLLFSPVELPSGADGPMLFRYTRPMRWFAAAATWLLLAAAFGGAWLIRRADGRWYGPLWLFGAASALVQVVTVTSGRYRLAMIPALFLLAALWLTRRADWRRKAAGILAGAALPALAWLAIPGWVGDPAEARSLLAEAHYRRGDAAKAAALLTGQVERSNDPGRDACLLGSALLETGDAAAAKHWFEYARAQAPETAAPAMNLALLAAAAGDAASAEQLFAEAEAREPGDADTLYNHGLFLEERGQWDAAAAKYLAALAAAPAHRQALNALGVLTFRRGNPAAAAEWFRRALRLAPDHEGLRRNLAAAEAAARAGGQGAF